MNFLKKASEFKPKSGLSPKFLLHKHLSGPYPARSLMHVHASSLTKPEGFCPRYYALHDMLGIKPKNEWLTAADVVTFDMGNDAQEMVVQWFADMGRAIGHWKCRSCKHVHLFQQRPEKCSCGCRVFKSEEVRFVSAVSGASCGVDLLLNMGEKKLVPIELKTMLKDQFKDLVMPLAEHRLRTNFYLRIIAESEHTWSTLVDTEQAWVVYVCKGGYVSDPNLGAWGLTDKFTPFKEFTIKRNDAQTDEHTKRAKVVKDFREGTVGMPCGICPNIMFKRAHYCAVKSACFGGEYPATYDWQDAQ